MKKLLFLLLALTVSAPAFAQTQTQYYTVPTIAALKAMTTSRPAVVQVVDANPGIFNLSAGACAAADDIFQVQPTGGTTVCYTRVATPYSVGKSATANGVLVTGGTGVPSVSTTLPNMNIGTPTAGVGTNITGTAAGLTAGNVTTNANLTGDVTSSGNATTLATVASAGTTGSSTAIPVVTINAKGLTTGITTAAVVAPAGTLTGATLASGVTASSLTSFGNSPTMVTPNLGTPSSLTLTNATGLPNAGLVNSATTVNGQTCTLGSTCTITAVAAAGTLTGTTLASNVVTSSLTSLGTIASLNYTAMNVGTQAQIVGSITGSTLTVDATYQGAVAAGMYIWVPKTAHITYGTYIVSGAGATWTLSAAVASPIASTTINLTSGSSGFNGWFGGDDIYHHTKLTTNQDITAVHPTYPEVGTQALMRSNVGLYSVVTISNASPGIVTMAGMNFASCAGCSQAFTFYDLGDTLPSPLDFVTTYYVKGDTISGDTFQISLTPGGAAINTTTTGSGTHAIGTKFTSYKVATSATALGGPLSANLYARNDVVRGYGGSGGYIVKGNEVDVTNYGNDSTSLTGQDYVVGMASILSNEGALTTAKGAAAYWAYAANSQWYHAYAHSGDSNNILWSNGTAVDGVDFTSATISGSPFKSTGFTVTNTGAVTGATLTSSGDIAAAAGSSIYWSGRSLLQSSSDGVVAFKNNAGTQGVAIDGSTSTFKVRDRANSSDANLTASTISASGDFNVATGQAYLVNSVSTLTATTLGSAVVNSSLTSVGTITTGTWNAGAVTSSGAIQAAAASGYYFGSTKFALKSGNYNLIYSPSGAASAIQIGNSTDPQTYYDNTGHVFRPLSPTGLNNYAIVGLGYFAVGNNGAVANATDVLSGYAASNATKSISFRNNDSGASADARMILGNNSDSLDFQIVLNSSGNSALGGARSANIITNSGPTIFYASRAAPVTQMILNTSGTVQMPNLTSVAQTNVLCWNSATGLATYQTWATGCLSSSARFKENIIPKSNAEALKIVAALEPVTFNYKKSANMGTDKHSGFIAEQVGKVAPDLVAYEDDGKTPRAVKYQELAPYFAGAIRELKAANDNFKVEIEQLKKKVK